MIAPARSAAFEVLSAVSAGRADLPTAIAYTRASLKDERDRALAAEIATGVMRWRAALDHLIVFFSKREIQRLDPEVVEILANRPGNQHVVITGRDAPQQLIDAADLVTEMTKVKHPMDAGRKGQRGIEW